MSLNRKYQEIIDELEKRISDKEEFEFVKNKLSELTLLYIDSIEKVTEIRDNQINQNDRIKKLENKIKTIEDDIYIDEEEDDDRMIPQKKLEEGYDFEIICPYCNKEFVVDESYNKKDKVECPNCKQTIELDWDEEIKEEKKIESEEETKNVPSVAEDKEDYIQEDQEQNNSEDDM